MSDPTPANPATRTIATAVPRLEEARPRACANHASRPPAAVCRACLKPVCGECATKLDGVNHCAECLARFHPAVPRVAATPAGPSALRFLAAAACYGAVALAAAVAGVGMPFFANERRLEANRERLTDVHLRLAAYFDDLGTYPSREHGLAALLAPAPEDRDRWRGPYVTSRAPGGRPAIDPREETAVLDVFGRPILYWASDVDREGGVPEKVYLASPGANGTWETSGILAGSPARDASGDDALQWVAWP